MGVRFAVLCSSRSPTMVLLAAISKASARFFRAACPKLMPPNRSPWLTAKAGTDVLAKRSPAEAGLSSQSKQG
jgi:hypothetical protein